MDTLIERAEREADAAEAHAQRARRRADEFRPAPPPASPPRPGAPPSPTFTHLPSPACHLGGADAQRSLGRHHAFERSCPLPPTIGASRFHVSSDALHTMAPVEMFRRDTPEAKSALLGIAMALDAHLRANGESARSPPRGTSEQLFCELRHPLDPPAGQRGHAAASVTHPVTPPARAALNDALPPALDLPSPAKSGAPAVTPAVTPAVPPVTTVAAIFELLAAFFDLVDVDLSLPVAAFIYVERALQHSRWPLRHSTWRRLLLCALLEAEKVLLELPTWNTDLIATFHHLGLFIAPAELARLEGAFVEAVGWRLLIRANEYAEYYFCLVALARGGGGGYAGGGCSAPHGCGHAAAPQAELARVGAALERAGAEAPPGGHASGAQGAAMVAALDLAALGERRSSGRECAERSSVSVSAAFELGDRRSSGGSGGEAKEVRARELPAQSSRRALAASSKPMSGNGYSEGHSECHANVVTVHFPQSPHRPHPQQQPRLPSRVLPSASAEACAACACAYGGGWGATGIAKTTDSGVESP